MPIFLFSDIEGSTKLWEDHRHAMPEILRRHDAILQEEIAIHGGWILDHTGDGVYAVFPGGERALDCTLAIQRRFLAMNWPAVESIRIRIGLDARLEDEKGRDYFVDANNDYFGPVVNYTARIMRAAWGEQILLSPQVLKLAALPEAAIIQDLGTHKLRGIPFPQKILGLTHPDLPRQSFPPLRTSVSQADALLNKLTPAEIDVGLNRLRDLIDERAPVLADAVKVAVGQAKVLQEYPEGLSTKQRGLWEEAVEFLNDICREVLDRSLRALALGHPVPAYDARCPFMGMAAFGPEERGFFFGRAELVAHLVQRWQTEPFLAILGPSGCGKSSLLRAGIAPALSAAIQNRPVFIMTPGRAPRQQLQATLKKQNAPFILLVDQFEELFTLCEDQTERNGFIDDLLALLPQNQLGLVMRADFLGACALFPGLRAQIQLHQELVGPMTAADLREAMVKQAAAAGLRFDHGLPAAIMQELAGEPGAMPLLQHTLLELWRRRHGRWLRLQEFQNMGTLSQAIARTADDIYVSATPAEQARIRDIFIRLTRLDTDAVDGERHHNTRQRVGLAELVPAGSQLADTLEIVNRLVNARLLVTSINAISNQEDVEVAHEALIRYWPRLNQWLDDDRTALRLRSSIREAAADWANADDAEADNFLLHRGSRLEDSQRFLVEGRLLLNKREQAYLDACLDLRQRELDQIQLQQQRELAQARELAHAQEQRLREQEEATLRLQRRAFALSILGTVALFLAILTLIANIEARQTARIALSQRLAAQAINELALPNHELALLLAIEANRAAPTSDALVTLRQALAFPGRVISIIDQGTRIDDFIWLNEGESLLTATADGQVVLWRLADRTAVRTFAHPAAVTHLALSPDHTLLLTAAEDGQARVWRLADGELLVELAHAAAVRAIGWSRDGERVLTGSDDGTVAIWAIASGSPLWMVTQRGSVIDARWSHNEDRVLTAGDSGQAFIWSTKEETALLELSHDEAIPLRSVHWNQADLQVVTTDANGQAIVWDSTTGGRLLELRHTAGINDAFWNQAETRLVTVGQDSRLKIWDAVEGTELLTLIHGSPVQRAYWNESENLLLTTSELGNIRVWDAASGLELVRLRLPSISQARFNPLDESQIITASTDGAIRVWSAVFGSERAIFRQDEGIWQARWHSSGRQVMTMSFDQRAIVWNIDDPQPRLVLPHEGAVLDADWSPGNSRIATGGDDRQAIVWDAATGLKLLSLPHEGAVFSVDWDRTGDRLLTTSARGNAFIWNAHDGTLLQTIDTGESGVLEALWNHDDSQILTAERGNMARVWDVASGQELLRFEHEALVRRAFWSPDESRILTASFDGSAAVWDAVSGAEIGRVHHDDQIAYASWHPDGDRFVTASRDAQARVWNAATGRLIFEMQHSGGVNHAIFNGDGTWIATGSSDSTVRIWDGATGDLLFILPHAGEIYMSAWNPDESLILTASADHYARLFYMNADLITEIACERVIRNLTWEEWDRFLGGIRYRPTCPNVPFPEE